MALKAELETWADALKEYDAENFEEAVKLFYNINEYSKIRTNLGLIFATVGDHETAVGHFQSAIEADKYLAVAYFQCGVSNFLLERYELAHQDFKDAFLYLRENQSINYGQLGLKFILYSAEVLFNKGLCQIYLGNTDAGMNDLKKAMSEQAADEHRVIQDAIRDRGEGYTVFSIPVGVLYRPPESKMRNTKARDYLGKAKLVAAADEGEAYTTFTGATRLRQGVTPKGVFIPEEEVKSDVQLSRSVTVPAPTNVDQINPVPLKRSKTTINVSVNRNQGLESETSEQPPPPPPSSRSKPERSMTDVGRNRNIQRDFTAPTRGLSLRSPKRALSPEQRSPLQQGSMNDFYGDYIDTYRDEDPVAPIRRNNTIAAWARNNANSESTLSRSPSTRPPPSSYTANNGLRRRGTAVSRQRSLAQRKRSYDEEEEGYGSGDYEDGSFYAESPKIRVKVRFGDETRGLALPQDSSRLELMAMLSSKFSISVNLLDVKFKDEDGTYVSIKDESDYEMALETAKETVNGKAEGKLEIVCSRKT